MSTSYIILRDIPKEEARLDLATYQIQGGFRGFQQVSAGAHYVSVRSGEEHKGFWCYLPAGAALVRHFDYERDEFELDDPDSEAQFQKLALSGAMNRALAQAHVGAGMLWRTLTSHIGPEAFPPTLHQETPMTPPYDLPPEELAQWMATNHKSRFEQALDGHEGDWVAFLGEFQFAFVRWLLADEDEEAYGRWRHLLQALYNVGERGIQKAPELFPPLVDTLMAQFDQLSDSFFGEGSFIVEGARYLVEDLIDVGIEGLEEKGRELQAFFEKRGVAL